MPLYQDPSKAANNYYNQIPDRTRGYYQPYFDAGQGQLGNLNDQYNNLLTNPGGKYNQIGESFHESPGFKFALQQALGANDRSAAARGLSTAPTHTQEQMQLATNLANQDYYNYMQGATGLYGEGLHGAQDMSHMGQQAGQNMGDIQAQTLAAQGQNAYSGAQSHNDMINGIFGGIAGLGGAALRNPFIGAALYNHFYPQKQQGQQGR